MEPESRLSRQLGSLLTLGSFSGLSDGQLLERFLTSQGESAERAFATLVERHGPLVLRVCRGILADVHDAEDAFQATFLVLVRKARRLWVEDSLGPWLHRVASRTSAHARAAALRRGRHEANAARPERTEGPSHDDLLPVLHEEIGRLPERYRAPVILCDLQECSHDQAARHLGWPVGTVKSRLSRARRRLRERLRRRGFAPAALLTGPDRTTHAAPSLPAELAVATCRTAADFVSPRTVTGGAAALAQGVLSTMNMTRWWKVACLVTVAGLTVSGAGVLSGRGGRAVEPDPGDQGKNAVETPVAAATRGPFRVVVSDSGSLEPSRSQELSSRFEGPTKIVSIRAEGSRVKKGDVVCELDSAGLDEQLKQQEVMARRAEVSHQSARLASQAAESAVREYQEGIALMEKARILGEVKLNEAAFVQAGDRVDRMRKARDRMMALQAGQEANTIADLVMRIDIEDRFDSAQIDLLRRRLAFQEAESRLNLHENFTRPKKTSILVIEVKKAQSEEAFSEQVLQLERQKCARLERQIAAGRLTSNLDGIVVYADSPYRAGEPARPQIKEGAAVRPHQSIARIVDLEAPMWINVQVGEAMVDRLKVGQKAQVQVDTFPKEKFTGVVISIAPKLDEAVWAQSRRKIYPTLIRIENGSPAFRPGMSGKAEITIVERVDALTIPIDAIQSHEGKHRVAVKKPDGGFEWRDVQIGDVDQASRRAEIKQGISAGEQVAVELSLLLRRGINLPTPKK